MTQCGINIEVITEPLFSSLKDKIQKLLEKVDLNRRLFSNNDRDAKKLNQIEDKNPYCILKKSILKEIEFSFLSCQFTKQQGCQ